MMAAGRCYPRHGNPDEGGGVDTADGYVIMHIYGLHQVEEALTADAGATILKRIAVPSGDRIANPPVALRGA
jgi:hypothetical protein